MNSDVKSASDVKSDSDLDLNTQVSLTGISDSAARKAIINSLENFRTIKNTDYKFVDVIALSDEKYVGQPVKLIASLSHMSDPAPFEIAQGKTRKRVSVVGLSFRDQRGDHIRSLNITQNRFIQLNLKSDIIRRFVLYGTVISILQNDRAEYSFLVHDVIPTISQLDLLHADEEDIEKTRVLIDSFRSTTDCKAYIKNALVEYYGIKGLDKAIELDKSINFTILQALSNGMSAGYMYSNKLHSLLIGAPASGKKLISMCAQLLSPNGKRVSSTNSKISPAGLIGHASKSGTTYTSNGGIIPSADQGVVCFEDYHEVSNKQNENSSILSMVMEDGKVEDSTAAKATHLAATSIHIDMNRNSQVKPDKKYNAYTDLCIPQNIISRFDFINEIPADIERQMEVSLEMIDRSDRLESNQFSTSENELKRKLQLIVAYVNTKYSSINYPQDVRDYVREKVKELFEENEKYLGLMNHFGSMLTRMINSIEKVSKAICASKLKDTISIEDIDEALTFIEYKLQFLSKLDLLNTANWDQKSITDEKKDERKIAIQAEFTGKDFTINEVSEFIQKQPDLCIKGRTTRRDINEMIASGIVKKVKHNEYKIIAKE